MTNDSGGAFKALTGSKEGSRVLSKMGKFKDLLNSPEGQAIISGLSESEAGEIKNAAAGFASGDAAAAPKLLSALTGTEEGKKLMKNIQDILNQ